LQQEVVEEEVDVLVVEVERVDADEVVREELEAAEDVVEDVDVADEVVVVFVDVELDELVELAQALPVHPDEVDIVPVLLVVTPSPPPNTRATATTDETHSMPMTMDTKRAVRLSIPLHLPLEGL